ncbi:N-6 DNA methylase [Cellulosimicrobium sp. TH-20]|uniref:N-6 DNA methylase n=1 Tax=Cellulosimicrobium sp. TH-20 TaxID=1980001 RepID=UPI001582EE63
MTAQRLIRPSDIASLAGVSAAAVANWRARADDFPELAGGTSARPLYDYDAVVAWLRENGKNVRETTAADLLWSFMDTVRGVLGPEQAGRLALSLLVVHKAALSSPDVASLWASATQADATHPEAALSGLFRGAADLIPGGHNLLHDRWPRTDLPGSGLPSLLGTLERIAEAELPEAASAVVDRMARSQGRMTGVSGAVDSASAQLLASLATRTNLVNASASKTTRLSGEAHATLANALPEILDLLAPTTAIRSAYDPACGISEALFAIHIAEPRASLTGRDVDADTIQVARQRAFLTGIEVDLAIADTLREDPWPSGRADAVVVEPPLGLSSRERLPDFDKRWQFGTPNGPAMDLAWLQDAVAHLSSSGRGYVLQPAGSLFRTGSAGAIRRELVAAGCIEAVIALPANLLTYTGIPLFAVVVRPATDPTDAVTFIDASTSDGVRHTTVPLADLLASADANLTPAMHLADASVADVDFAYQAKASWSAVAETVKALHATTVPTIPRVNFAGTRVMSIGELVKSGAVREMWRGSVRPGEGGSIPENVVRPQHVREGLPEPAGGELAPRERLTAPGDVLLTTQLSIESTVDETGGHAVSNQVTVLSLHPDALRPRFVALAIKGEWNDRFLMGSAIKRANVKDLEIPLPSLGIQDEIISSLTAAAALAAAADEARARTSTYVADVMAAVRYGANLTPAGA